MSERRELGTMKRRNSFASVPRIMNENGSAVDVRPILTEELPLESVRQPETPTNASKFADEKAELPTGANRPPETSVTTTSVAISRISSALVGRNSIASSAYPESGTIVVGPGDHERMTANGAAVDTAVGGWACANAAMTTLRSAPTCGLDGLIMRVTRGASFGRPNALS